MKKRMWLVFVLASAFLLLLSSASLAKALSDGKEFGSKQGVGAPVVILPQPTLGGADPGDDDTPDRSGHGDLGIPGSNSGGTLANAGDASLRSMKDWWASFRLQLLTVLRVWK